MLTRRSSKLVETAQLMVESTGTLGPAKGKARAVDESVNFRKMAADCFWRTFLFSLLFIAYLTLYSDFLPLYNFSRLTA